MMHLLKPKIPFKERSFQTISKLNLLKLNHTPPHILTLKVLKPLNHPIMLAPANLIPLHTNPQLFLHIILMFQWTKVFYCARIVIEEDLALEEEGLVVEVELF